MSAVISAPPSPQTLVISMECKQWQLAHSSWPYTQNSWPFWLWFVGYYQTIPYTAIYQSSSTGIKFSRADQCLAVNLFEVFGLFIWNTVHGVSNEVSQHWIPSYTANRLLLLLQCYTVLLCLPMHLYVHEKINEVSMCHKWCHSFHW